jgi:hypothetical protein
MDAMGQSSAERSDGLPTGVGSVDPDATWRPGRTALLADGRSGHDDPGDPVQHAAVSPWSREAIESPLPSIEAIRHRWRTELGLDAVDRTPT